MDLAAGGKLTGRREWGKIMGETNGAGFGGGEENMDYRIYERRAQYYETDQMGVVHHSNYIRWFEEARVFFMDQMGFGYDEMEKSGVSSR